MAFRVDHRCRGSEPGLEPCTLEKIKKGIRTSSASNLTRAWTVYPIPEFEFVRSGVDFSATVRNDSCRCHFFVESPDGT